MGADGLEPLSEFKHSRILEAGAVCEAVVVEEDTIACYVQAAWHPPVLRESDGHWAVEVAATDDEAAAAAVRFVVSRTSNATRWVFWARRPSDVRVAGRLGLESTRTLRKLAVRLPVEPAPSPPDGIRVTPFRPGRDEDAWIAANNAAFAGHPENGAVDRIELARRHAQPWFDAPGLRMAWAGRRLVGSCWTKVHENGEGEIYVIGVRPEMQARGIGRFLVLEGLRYLWEERGVTVGTLWVDDTSLGALALYAGLGFETLHTISQYEPIDRRS